MPWADNNTTAAVNNFSNFVNNMEDRAVAKTERDRVIKLRDQLDEAGKFVYSTMASLTPDEQRDPGVLSKMVADLKAKGLPGEIIQKSVELAMNYTKQTAELHKEMALGKAAKTLGGADATPETLKLTTDYNAATTQTATNKSLGSHYDQSVLESKHKMDPNSLENLEKSKLNAAQIKNYEASANRDNAYAGYLKEGGKQTTKTFEEPNKESKDSAKLIIGQTIMGQLSAKNYPDLRFKQDPLTNRMIVSVPSGTPKKDVEAIINAAGGVITNTLDKKEVINTGMFNKNRELTQYEFEPSGAAVHALGIKLQNPGRSLEQLSGVPVTPGAQGAVQETPDVVIDPTKVSNIYENIIKSVSDPKGIEHVKPSETYVPPQMRKMDGSTLDSLTPGIEKIRQALKQTKGFLSGPDPEEVLRNRK